METVLFYIHYALLLLFGIILSAAFAGVRVPTRQNTCILGSLFVVCGLIQLAAYLIFDEDTVWKIYPLITHVPILVLLCLYYRKRLITALAAVCVAYLCCQPSKWFALLLFAFTHSNLLAMAVRIPTLLAVGFLSIWYLAPLVSELYNKDNRSVWIFSMIPMVYYLFDYITGVYSTLLEENHLVAVEFLPFFLCVVYLLFCVIYYREYEKKADAQRREQLIRITAQQQAREIEAVKRSEHEIRLLRHDMRMLLSSLSLCIAEGDQETARKLITGYTSRIDATVVQRYCESDTLNYLLSDYAARCREQGVPFTCQVELAGALPDEILLGSILSNALDNALNAQLEVPEEKRRISLMLKTSNGKLLLSVKNPFGKKPVFADGIPVSNRAGHGYGTQSIRYMTERLGGICQFTLEKDRFILRVVI